MNSIVKKHGVGWPPETMRNSSYNSSIRPRLMIDNKSWKQIHTFTSSMLVELNQHAAGERVDLLDDYDFPARTITEVVKLSNAQKTSVCNPGVFYSSSRPGDWATYTVWDNQSLHLFYGTMLRWRFRKVHSHERCLHGAFRFNLDPSVFLRKWPTIVKLLSF